MASMARCLQSQVILKQWFFNHESCYHNHGLPINAWQDARHLQATEGQGIWRDFYDPGEAAAWAVSEGMGYKDGYVIIAPAAVEAKIPAGMQAA